MNAIAQLLAEFARVSACDLSNSVPPETAFLSSAEDLLEKFRHIKPPPRRCPTSLLEIAGYPRLESACSNILAFFLDPSKEHGFRDEVLRSLLMAAGEEVQSLGRATIRQEVPTDRGRIDILVETEGLVIGIENKIAHHSESNPFDDYCHYLGKIAKGSGSTCVAILLNLHGEKHRESFKCFRPVSYDSFFQHLLCRLGNAALDGDRRYLGYLLDFVETIRNLKQGLQMDMPLLEFLKAVDHEKNALTLFRRMSVLAQDLRSRTKRVRERTTLSPGLAIRFYGAFYEGLNDEDNDDIYDACSCEISIFPDFVVQVDAWVSLRSGWQVTVNPVNKSRRPELRTWLSSKGLVSKPGSHEEWIFEKFNFDEKNERAVAEKYQELIATIVKHASAAGKPESAVASKPDRRSTAGKRRSSDTQQQLEK